MRLIDADALLEKVREIRKLALDRAVETPANMPFPIYQNPAYTRYSTQADEREKFKVMIEEAPSVQPERKTGRWIESNPQNSKLCRLMTCSECGKAYIVNINVPYEDWTEAHKFCVECGAKMKGGEQDGQKNN